MTTMTQPTPIRRHPNGSIDTGYYMARGRAIRSREAHGALHRLTAWLRRPAAPKAAKSTVAA